MHRRLLLLARDSRVALIFTILTGLLAGLLTISQSYFLSTTINGVFLEKQTLLQVWNWMRLLLIIIAARGLAVWINEVAANEVAVRVKTDLRTRLFSQILALGPAYTRGERTGDLTTTAVEGVEALHAYFSQYLPQLVISTLVPVSILILVFPLDPLSAIVLLVTAPLIPFFMYMIGRGAQAVTKRQYETLSRLSSHFLDSLQGLTTLKLFGQSKAQAQNMARVSDQYRNTTLKVLQVTFLSAFALELLATISTAIIAVEVGLRLLYAQMRFREALFLLILAPEFYLPLRMLGLRFHAGMAGTSAARRIFEILDMPVENRKQRAEGSSVLSSPFSTLHLSNLSYTYPGESTPALDQINLEIRAGQHIALVGASGAGKTTLANLLLRFMEPTSGTITINNKPITSIPLEDWRTKIAWVPQNPHLFHDTIAANIRLAKPDASEEEIAAAARAAHLDDFIESLPEKYETVVGEAGARLSSGQAQRLVLARAFLKDAPILILDEPTSNLDPETETMLEASTRLLMHGRTVITIAHRMNTVFQADHIAVLKEGRLVETGTHRQLLESNGAYAAMVKSGIGNREPGLGKKASPQPPAANSLLPIINRQPPTANRPLLNANSQQSTFSRLLQFLQGSWNWVVLSVLLGSLTIGSSVALLGTSAWLISIAALHPSIAALEVAIVGVRFFGLSRAVFRYLERLVSHNTTFRLLGRLRVWFYEKLEPLAPARLMDYHAGDLLAHILADVETLENFYVRVVAPPLIAILVGIGVSLFLVYFDPRLAALLIAFFMLIGLFLPLIAQTTSNRFGADVIARRADLHMQLVDGIQGLADILAFGRGPDRLAQVQSTGRKYGDSQRELAQISGLHSGLSTFLTNGALWLVLLLIIPRITSGQMDGVLLAPLTLITLASFEAVMPLSLAAQTWTSARSAAQRLFEVVDTKPEVIDSRDKRLANRDKRLEAAPTYSLLPNHLFSNQQFSTLEFSDLSFTYPGSTIPALQHITFSVQSGQSIAIVGPSGAGKSTLASLLLRFWDFHAGDICLDGQSIKSYVPDEIRERIALVSQNAYFFNTSIYENLRMARRGATRAQVESAARAAQIHEFILSLPNAYDTMIGERGLRLSCGERQRLAIARAVLKAAPILILDEPTANLDPLTEEQVLATLFRLNRNQTSLWITHRLIGLENMDEIMVLEHGRIVERGQQSELLNRAGCYRRLWELQNRIFVDT